MQNVYVVLYFSDQTVLYLLVVILAQSAVLLNHIMKLQLCMVCVKGSLFLYQFSKNTSEEFFLHPFIRRLFYHVWSCKNC